MYWLWFMFFTCQPEFLLVGFTGIFGKEAKKAAEDLARGIGIIVFIIIALTAIASLIYFLGKSAGLIH